MAKKTIYRLGSSPLINTPGILRWAISGYHFRKDRKNLLKVFTTGYKGTKKHPAPSEEVFHRLLLGKIPFTVENEDTVVFEVESCDS